MSLCQHGYTAFWDCPICPEPMGTRYRPQEGRDIRPDPDRLVIDDDHCPNCGMLWIWNGDTEEDRICPPCKSGE